MLEYKIEKINEISSTTNEVKRLAKAGLVQPGYVLIAEKQTDGHGQFGRKFESPPGGLYMSIYHKKELPCKIEGLTLEIGKILQKTTKNLTGLDTTIKEPNDILYNGKKLCGVLVESFTLANELHMVIGIGLNLNTDIKQFPPELLDTADSISNIINKKIDSAIMAESILNNIKEIL